MSTSQLCVQQRQQEQQQLRKILWLCLAGSIVIHGILALTLSRQLDILATQPPQVKKPIKFILVEQPKPKPQPKPQPEPTKIVPKPKLAAPQPELSVPEPSEPAPQSPRPQPAVPQHKVSAPVPQPEPKLREPQLPKSQLAEPRHKLFVPKLKPEPPEPLSSKPLPEAPQHKVPAPKKILTSNQPSAAKIPVAPKSPQAIASPSDNIFPPNKKPSSQVATNSSAPSNSESESTESETTESENDGGDISCINNCEPEYPEVLNGAEGHASVRLTLDKDGNVIGVAIANPDHNLDINRQALLAARQMQFSSPGDQVASVIVKINFTIEDSEFDHFAREQQAVSQ